MEVKTLHPSVIQELIAVTDVVVPGGKGDRLRHVWRHDGVEVHRTTEETSRIAGPKGVVRLRSSLTGKDLPAQPRRARGRSTSRPRTTSSSGAPSSTSRSDTPAASSTSTARRSDGRGSTGGPLKGGTCATDSASDTHWPVVVPVKGTLMATWETFPSLPKVTFAEAMPQTLPRLQWTISCDAASSATFAARAGKWAVGAGVSAGADAGADADAGASADADAGASPDPDAAAEGVTDGAVVASSGAEGAWRRMTVTTTTTPIEAPTTPATTEARSAPDRRVRTGISMIGKVGVWGSFGASGGEGGGSHAGAGGIGGAGRGSGESTATITGGSAGVAARGGGGVATTCTGGRLGSPWGAASITGRGSGSYVEPAGRPG